MKVAGFGFRAATTVEALREALTIVEAQGGAVDALATVPAKASAGALRALAAERDLPIHAVAVDGVTTPTQSVRIQALHGTGSVAEAAALVAAGPGAQLLVARMSGPCGMVTCAMATTEGEAE